MTGPDPAAAADWRHVSALLAKAWRYRAQADR